MKKRYYYIVLLLQCLGRKTIKARINARTKWIGQKPLFSLEFSTFAFPKFSEKCSEPRGGTLAMRTHMHLWHRATEFQTTRQLFYWIPERGIHAWYCGTVSNWGPKEWKSRQSISFFLASSGRRDCALQDKARPQHRVAVNRCKFRSTTVASPSDYWQRLQSRHSTIVLMSGFASAEAAWHRISECNWRRWRGPGQSESWQIQL